MDASLERRERLPLEATGREEFSTGLWTPPRGHRTGRRVVRIDDIHSPVDKDAQQPENSAERATSGTKPPGQFVSEELEAQTARFIAAVKDLARHRQAAQQGRGLPPPPPPPRRDQRSRRL
jgi:hypothetical protein